MSLIILSRAHKLMAQGVTLPEYLGFSKYSEWVYSNQISSLVCFALGNIGYRVGVLDMMEYSDDVAVINNCRPVCCAEIHLNAPPPNTKRADGYSAVLYYVTSKKGKELAEIMAESLAVVVPWKYSVEYPKGATNVNGVLTAGVPNQYYNRGEQFLRETNMPSIIIEPGFVTNPKHIGWLHIAKNKITLAAAITSGINDFVFKVYGAKQEAFDKDFYSRPVLDRINIIKEKFLRLF